MGPLEKHLFARRVCQVAKSGLDPMLTFQLQSRSQLAGEPALPEEQSLSHPFREAGELQGVGPTRLSSMC